MTRRLQALVPLDHLSNACLLVCLLVCLLAEGGAGLGDMGKAPCMAQAMQRWLIFYYREGQGTRTVIWRRSKRLAWRAARQLMRRRYWVAVEPE